MKLTYALLLLIFSIIISSEITGIYYLYEFKNALQVDIMNRAEETTTMMVNRIDSHVIERLVDMIILSKSDTIQTAIKASNMQFSKMTNPEQYVNNMDSLWTSAPKNETTPFMKTLIDSNPSEQLRQIENSENSLFHGKVYGEIFMTNIYGAIVLETGKTSDYKQSDETWWQQAKKNGVFLGDEEFDNSSKTIAYTIAYRLDDENGNFIGVAKEVVNVQLIIDIIKSQMNIQQGMNPVEFELIKSDGTTIYSTELDEKAGSKTLEVEFLDNMKDFSGHFIFTNNDQKYLIAYSHSSNSKISPIFNWLFITKYKVQDVLQPVYAISNYITTIMFTFLIAMSLITFMISKKLVIPLEKIQKGLISFKNGNRVEIKPSGTTETRELIEQFNFMTEEISNFQHRLSKSEEKFRMLFELSPVVIIFGDDKHNIITMNQRFVEIFGYNKDEVIGKPVSIIVPERSMSEFKEFQLKSTNKVSSKKVWLIKKDNTVFPCIISAQKIYDQNNELGYIAVIKDITELEEASKKIEEDEEKLRKSESVYRGLFELSPDPIRISTLDRFTIDVNKAYLEKFGYTREELIGKSIYVNINEESREGMEKAFSELRKGKTVQNVESKYHKKDGTTIPILLSISPFNDQKNNSIGYISIIKDITEIVKAREEDKEREKETVAQYFKTKQIEEMKNQFSSMISHELTTPLFPIKFQAEMLKDPKILGKLNKEQTNAINEIYQNAIQLERLIGDILDAQKLEMNEMRFIKTEFELKQFMNQISDTGKNLIDNKKIELKNSFNDQQLTLVSDPDRLIQVFVNLIKNSVDFVQENTGKIEVGATVQENDVLFYVKDNGIGIPKDKQPNLFKKFYQIDTSLKRSHRGSGLGLSICKGIVEGLGGKIWLESTEGLGTIVYFTIPKKNVDNE